MKNIQIPYRVQYQAAIIGLICCVLCIAGSTQANSPKPVAISGVTDLSRHDLYRDGIIRLDGQWQFFQGRVVTPGSFIDGNAPEPTGYFQVPGYWTSYKGLSLPPKGTGSYRLLIHVPGKNRPLSLMTPEIFTEYKLYVNGNIIDSHGRFSGGTIRFLSPRVFTFQNNRDTIEIILNIANENHGNAGIGQSFFIGTPREIHRKYLFNTIVEMILVAVCLFAGIYHAILFAFRKTETELLYFALFCIFIALRTMLTGTTMITQLMPDLPFTFGSRAATAVIPLCVITFQTYAFKFFTPSFPGVLHRVLLTCHGIYLTISLTLPPMLYSRLFTPYLLVILASGFLITGANIYAMTRGMPYATIFLAGFLFVFAGAASDMLHYIQVVNTGYYMSLWFSFFIVAQSAMLAIKLSNAHQMVETLSKQLRVSNKLKDEFLANTSHELRTPINGIIGISDSLIDGVAGKLPEQALGNLKLISSSAKRLTRLINDILDHSKLKNNALSLAIKNIDLRQITQVVVTVVEETMPAGHVQLINDVDDQLPHVKGDEDRLQQILFNLIGNALKFTEEGHVRIWARDLDTHVIVHIEDTGPGIPEHMFDTIFEAFHQIDGTPTRGHGGTGLGLPITQKLVTLQGGRIHVRSVEGKGATFSFTLPKGTNMKGPASQGKLSLKMGAIPEIHLPGTVLPAPQPTHCDDGGTCETILIVDDDTTNIRVLQNFLMLENYRSGYATNGLKALEMIETRKFDLVLLDIMMPHMSGYEVLNRIREKHTIYQLPVLMLTARTRNRDIVTAFQTGANDYLTKPIGRQELMARIRTQLSLSHAVAEAIKNADLANTDELTGLHNRRFLINTGNREITNAVLRNKPLSVIILDIDFFKKINDHYGHAEGDKVLQHLARTMFRNIRGGDVAARYGGEEFVIILPGMAADAAGQAAEKIRRLVAQDQVMTAEDKIIKYTVSFGVASFCDQAGSFEDLLKEADKMLYKSKTEGRNQVSVSRCSVTAH